MTSVIPEGWTGKLMTGMAGVILALVVYIFTTSLSGTSARISTLETVKADRAEVEAVKSMVYDLKSTQQEILKTVRRIEIKQAKNGMDGE